MKAKTCYNQGFGQQRNLKKISSEIGTNIVLPYKQNLSPCPDVWLTGICQFLSFKVESERGYKVMPLTEESFILD